MNIFKTGKKISFYVKSMNRFNYNKVSIYHNKCINFQKHIKESLITETVCKKTCNAKFSLKSSRVCVFLYNFVLMYVD